VAVAGRAAALKVDEMTTDQAAAMLAASLPPDGLAPAALAELARRLGEWPMLLNLFAGHVRESVAEGQDAADAVRHLLAVLDQAGITALDRASEIDRNQAVSATLGVSLARLGVAERTALYELAIFPEDADIGLEVVAQLWSTSQTLAIERVRRYANLSLVRLDLHAGTMRLHDVMRSYFTRQLGPCEGVHARLLAAWPERYDLPHDYAWRNLGYHLTGADRGAELRGLLGSFRWLRAKLASTDAGALVADYDRLPEKDPLRLLQDALRLAFDFLVRDPDQLASQLAGRLRSGRHPDLDALLAEIAAWRARPWLRPLRPTCMRPADRWCALSAATRAGTAARCARLPSTAMVDGRYQPATPIPTRP
jgi:hypothetical protein